MGWLILVSLIWAPSPGLIRHWLPGATVDPAFVSCARVALSLLVFAPLLRVRGRTGRDAAMLAAIGAVQFGAMYVCYTTSLQLLPAYAVAVLTIFTPMLVCIFDDLLTQRLRLWPYAAAALATIGAGVIIMNRPLEANDWKGIALVQLSNACFAIGQVLYRRWRRARPEVVDAQVFALLYAGAVIVTLPVAWPAADVALRLTGAQWLVLFFLGTIASGLGFFLWNVGAARTSAASLAVANNLKIPLMVLCSLLVFREQADIPRLLIGGTLVVVAGVIAERTDRPRKTLPP